MWVDQVTVDGIFGALRDRADLLRAIDNGEKME